MVTCTILPHHIYDSRGFSNSEMLNMMIDTPSSFFSDDRQDIYRFDIADFYGFVVLRIACRNDNRHSRYEEKL